MARIDRDSFHKLVDFQEPMMAEETRKSFLEYALFGSRCLKSYLKISQVSARQGIIR